MRPIKLVMQAFGSYGRKSEIDFTKSKQNLFLITGDTGAGKTTIFDAIVFALFGEAGSVYNKKSGEELQSQFVDYGNEPFVEFTFTEKVGSVEQEYRVRRTPKHIRPYKKGREGYTDEKEKVSLFFQDNTEFSQNLKETNNKIEEIIKLTKNQFMQVSMIAQGEFMEVLRGNDKQAIFRKLFNTEIYQDLIKELKIRSENKKSELKDFSSQCRLLINGIRVPDSIWADFDTFEIKGEADITDFERAKDNLSKLCDELKKLIEIKQTEDKKLFAGRDRKNRELAEAEQLLGFFFELEKAKKEVNSLELKKEEIENLKKSVKDIETAYEIETLYLSFTEAGKSFDYAKKELTDKKAGLPRLKSDYEEACKTEGLAKADYDIKSENFTKVSEKVRKALESFSNIEAKKSEKALKESEKEKAMEKSAEAAGKLKEFEALKNSWEAAVKELPDLEKAYAEAERSVNSCKKVMDEVKNLSEAYDKLVSAQEKVEKHQKIYEAELNKFKLAEDELIPKRRLFYDLRAGLLARDLLIKGEPCPVCGSVSHPAPCKLPDGQEEINKEEIDELEERLSKLKDSVNLKFSELEGYKIKVKERKEHLSLDKSKLISLINEELFTMEISLENETEIGLKEINKKIRTFSDSRQEELDNLSIKIKKISIINENLSTAEEKKSRLKQAEEAAKEREIELVKELSGIDAAIREIETGLEYRTKEEAVEAEKERALEKAKAEKLYLNSEKKSKEVKSLKERTEAVIEKLEADLPLLEKSRKDKEAEYLKSLSDKNISEGKWQDVVKKYKKSEKDEFTGTINKYLSDKRVAENMIIKMKEATKDREKPDISLLQSEFRAMEAAYNELHAKLEAIRADYRVDGEILKKLNSALEGRGAIAEDYRVISNLCDRLSGKVSGMRMDIETFVQRRYLEKILVSANKRFSNMSSRQFELRTYELDKAGEGKNRGLDLMVYSSVTGKSRDVRTLSGGESFMAALSLALGMADQIQERSGAVNLEMMFVDEGFGTLDDNSRNQAVKILKNMAGGSKLIGIISHVSELKQEIEEQLIVTKDDNGSKARWQLS